MVTGMDARRPVSRGRFWLLALLWLPAGVMAAAALRLPLEEGPAVDFGIGPAPALTAAGSLVLVAPCGLLLALACRRLRRLGYRRGAWWAGGAAARARQFGPPAPGHFAASAVQASRSSPSLA